MRVKSFVGGAVILMLAGFVVRILGFVYRIYLSNLIGAEGMGLFQLIAPVYSLIILTLTSGISIAVSKMVAAELAKNHIINLRRITRCALAVVGSSGAVIAVLVFLNIDFIALDILKDERTILSLKLLMPCIPVIAAASAIKGYFYGIQDVVPTAASQIAEQIVRITIVMLMAASFAEVGLEYACALATIGMALGEISNLAVLFIVYKFKGKKTGRVISKYGFKRKRFILRDILKISLPVSANRFATSIMSAVENILIPGMLLAGGLDYHKSLEEYGRLAGMAMPLIYFPSLVTSSLATTLVPAISEGMSLRSIRVVNYRISKSIQLSFILGIIFTVIFLRFPHEIGGILYRRENIGEMLYLLSFTCVFLYLQQTLLGIMNGLGKQGISLANSIAGYSIRIGFVYFCIPVYGVKGYIWGMTLSMFVVCVLNLAAVVRTTGMVIDLRNWIIKPGLAGLVVFLSAEHIYRFFTIFIASHVWAMLFALAGNALLAIVLMIAVGALERKEACKIFGFERVNSFIKKM